MVFYESSPTLFYKEGAGILVADRHAPFDMSAVRLVEERTPSRPTGYAGAWPFKVEGNGQHPQGGPVGHSQWRRRRLRAQRRGRDGARPFNAGRTSGLPHFRWLLWDYGLGLRFCGNDEGMILARRVGTSRRYADLIPYFFIRRCTVFRSTQAAFAACEILPSCRLRSRIR